MTDAWNMMGGQVYVAPSWADPKDPSRWHQLGTLTEIATERQTDRWHHRGEVIEAITGAPEYTLTTQGPVTLFRPEPVDKIVNNRGGTRKEEKHMGAAREFRDEKGGKTLSVQADRVQHTQAGGGVHLDIIGRRSYGWFEKADVPLIAHALFEKSGWPDATEDGYGAYKVTVDGESGVSWNVDSERRANKALAEAVANLAAYNAWVEGAAARLEAEVAAEAARVEAEERRAAENARKREHDALRTSAIALEALELYNAWYTGSTSSPPYESWSAVNSGDGCTDEKVRLWIAKAEAARAFKAAALAPLADWERELLEGAKPAPKVGDRVRVSAEGVDESGANFAGEVEGVVVASVDRDGDILVRALASCRTRETDQYVKPKYVTILATAEDLAAEAKAERDAGIAAIQEHIGSRVTAECMYAEGFRLIK